MAFRIPDEKISEIKQSADIVEVVSEVVRLKKAGKNFIGLCPFHSEKTPSFTVNPDKQIFHCFGCQEGGDVFSFLMKHESLSYPEAIRSLGERYGIAIPERSGYGGQVGGGKSEREQIIELNYLANRYFSDTLANDPGGKGAAYLKGRGIVGDMISRFSIGYAPEGWDHLLKFFSRKKISYKLLEKTGLIVPKKSNSGFYDRFRNRIIFPICDANGQTIGFGGRSIDDSLPKYLNSPETSVYNKSRSLYGIHRAKKKGRAENTIYIVEGYLDCITLHQNDIENSVATLGTALTTDHIRILKGVAEKIILVFDSDNAGIKAAERSVGLFIKQDVKARIMILPEGHDPDSYLRAFGKENFIHISEKALGLIKFLIETAVKKHGMTAEGKIKVVNDLIEPLSSIEDRVAKSIYIKELAEIMDISEAAIAARVNEVMSGKTKIGLSRMPQDHPGMLKTSVQSVNTRSERRILAMMLQFPKVLPEIKRYQVLNYFQDDLYKSIGMYILNLKNRTENIVSDALTHIDSDRKKRIIAELSICEDNWNHNGCRKLLRQFVDNARTHKEKELNEKIRTAEKNDDQELLLKLLVEKQKNAIHAEKQKMRLFDAK